MNKSYLAHAGLLLVNLIYGANHTIAKEVMPDFLAPFSFITVRVIGALLLFLLVHSFFVREKIEKKDLPRFILSALFGVVINQSLFFKGLSMSTPIHSAIITTTHPIEVMIFASILLKETITFKKISGLVLGASGALLLIVLGKQIGGGTNTMVGDILIFINALSYSIFIVIVKPLMVKYHPVTVIKWIFLLGACMVLPFGFKEVLATNWSAMPGSILMAIAFVVIMATFCGYLLNIGALSVLNASVVSIYVYIQPVLAVITAIALGKDKLTFFSTTAMLMVFAGVYLVSKPSKE